MYLCEGSLRAFRKSFYKTVRFPDKSADDAYPFLLLDDPTKFKSVKKAKIHYRLPLTINDFISQQVRYSKSISIHEDNFGSEITNKYFVINRRDKFMGIARSFIATPFWTIMYLLFEIIAKIFILYSAKETNARWKVLKSTRI